MNNELQQIEDYLSDLDQVFRKMKNSFEKVMVLAKLNELVFWLEMLKEDEAEDE